MNFFDKLKDETNKTVLTLLGFNTLVYVAMSVYTPYISVHYSNLGMNSFQIGILAALGPLSAVLVQPLWGMLSDRTGSGAKILRMLTVGSMAAVLLYLFSRSFISLAVVTFLFVSFNTALIPLGDAIAVSYLASRNYSFSRVRIGGTVGYAISVAVAGHFIRKNEYLSFILCAAFLLLLFICIGGMPQNHTTQRIKGRLEISKLVKNRRILFVLFFACVFQMVLSCNMAFLGVYIKELNYSSQEIGIAMMVSASSEIPVLLVIDKILKRYSVHAIMLFSGIMMAVRVFVLYLARDMTLIIAAQLLHGVTYMTVYYSCVTFINKNVDDSLKATGQSMLHLVQTGIGSVVGNILGGYVANRIGIGNTYMVCSLFILTVTIICGSALVIFRRNAGQGSDF